MSINTDVRMANPNAAANRSVNTAVWVRNPGPIADVAMRNAAPRRTLIVLAELFLSVNILPSDISVTSVFLRGQASLISVYANNLPIIKFGTFDTRPPIQKNRFFAYHSIVFYEKKK